MEYHVMYFNIEEGYSTYIDENVSAKISENPDSVRLNSTVKIKGATYVRFVDHAPTDEDVNIFYKDIKQGVKYDKILHYKAYLEYAKIGKDLKSKFKK